MGHVMLGLFSWLSAYATQAPDHPERPKSCLLGCLVGFLIKTFFKKKSIIEGIRVISRIPIIHLTLLNEEERRWLPVPP
jgi:hypothetical protein